MTYRVLSEELSSRIKEMRWLGFISQDYFITHESQLEIVNSKTRNVIVVRTFQETNTVGVNNDVRLEV